MKIDDKKYLELRQKAEEILENIDYETDDKLLSIKQMLEELNILHIELELQNDEVKKGQEQVEKAFEQYQDLYDNAPVAYFTFNESANIARLNNAAARLLGKNHNELIYKSFMKYVNKECKATFFQHFKKAVETEEQQKCEISITNETGKKCYLHLQTNPYRNPDDNTVSCLTTATDISAQKEYELIYKALLDNPLHGLIIAQDNQVKYINERVTEITGYTKTDLNAMYALRRNMVHPDDRYLIEKLSKRIFSGEAMQDTLEIRFFHKSGRLLWLSSFMRLINYFGKPAIMQTFIDITKQKQNAEQLTYLAAIVENAGHIAVIKDLDLRVIATNKAYVKAAGKESVKELIGKTDAEIFNVPPETEPVKTYMEDERKAQKLRPGEKIFREEKVMYPNGEERWVFTEKFPVFGEEKQVIATANISTDITGRVRAEQALKQSEQRYQTLSDATFEAIFISEKGICRNQNQSAEKMFGYSLKEAIGRHATEWIVPEHREKVKQKMLENYTRPYEVDALRKDGSVFPAEIQAQTVHVGGRPLRITALRDITERKKAREQIQLQNEKLKELNATKDRFFSIIAHDLKNPFHTLMSISGLLLKKYEKLTEEKRKRFIQALVDTSSGAYSLLENLLMWSRAQSGTISFTPVSKPVKTIVDENIKLINQNTAEKSIHLVVDSMAPDSKVLADENMLNTIMRNLLSNAVKFTNEGGTIVVTWRKTEDATVELSVSDTGVGISPDNMDKLFRVDETFSTRGTNSEKGTGLGLILCKEFIEKHNGKIWAESVEGEGSTFFITVPESRQ